MERESLREMKRDGVREREIRDRVQERRRNGQETRRNGKVEIRGEKKR